MLNCIAIDNELLELELIKAFCQKINFVDLKRTFLSAKEAMNFLHEEPIDLIITEIKMQEMDGMSIPSLVSPQVQIVFVTAYEKYAAQSYDFNTTDYIIKPVSFNRFHKAMLKCQHKKVLIQKNITTTDESLRHLIVKGGKEIHQIRIDQIIYVEGDKDYAWIRLANNEKIMIRESMKNILEVLKNYNFIRVHRSFIVSLVHINSIEGLTIKIGEHKIPLNKVSKEYILSEFKKRGILGWRFS
jgi:DNA-binding LytR/AlgR family response regulator